MSKLKISGKVLSIQLGRDETQIVLMGKGAEVLHSVVLPTPEGAVEDGMIRNEEAVRNLLKTALKAQEFRRVNQAVFVLGSSQVITETVTTPDLNEAKLEKLLEANVDRYFPVDMKDYQLVWQVVGPNDTGSDLKELLVQLWAVPKAMLAPYYRVGNGCGLSVLAVDYCGHSIATAVGASFVRKGKAAKAKTRKKEKEAPAASLDSDEEGQLAAPVAVAEKTASHTQMYLTLEKDLLGMTFVQNSRVVYQRFIRCGSDPLYQLGELAMMLDYFQSLDAGNGGNVIGYAAGSLCGDRVLMQELEDMLAMELAPVEDALHAMCIGAAHTTMDFGNPSLNRPGKARRELRSQLWQYVLILVGGLVLMAVLMLLLSSRIVWSTGIGVLDSTQQSLMLQAAKVSGFADNYKKYSDKYDSYSADWDTVFASLRTYNDNLVLVLDELEKTLPENTSVTGLAIGADGIQASFACATKEEAAYLIMALRNLQYASLLGITDLQGGGIGPATSYGSEEPPKEGSGGSALSDLIASELSSEDLETLASGITLEQIQTLEQAYGADAETVHNDLAHLKSTQSYDEQPFSNQKDEFGNDDASRADVRALRAMLTGNPFAAERFADMLINEDFDRGGEAILLPHIMLDIVRLQQSGKLDTENDLMGSMNAVVDVLVKNEATLLKTEALLKTDPDMEAWYVYYVEVELTVQPERPMPFLDPEKLMADLADGQFNSGDTALDAKLNGMISSDTRELIAKLNSEEEMSKMVGDYFANGSTGYPIVDGLIKEYMEKGTTGIPALDEKISEYVGSSDLTDQITELFDKYLKDGTTGDDSMNLLIQNYLTTGTTNNKELDKVIDDYIASGALDGVMDEMMNRYLEKGTTDNDVFDKMIQDYLTTGSTGNKKIDALIDDYVASGALNNVMGDMMNKYLKDGTTNNPVFDKLIENYLTTGSTGNKKLDALIDRQLATTDMGGMLTGMLKDYFLKGSTGIPAVDKMIKNFMTTGTTGNKAVDKLIRNYLKNAGNLIPDLPGIPDAPGGSAPDVDIPGLGELPLDQVIGNLTVNQISQLINNYLVYGETGNALLDSMTDDYFEKGTTGISALDKLIEEYINQGLATDDLANLIIKFMVEGSTGIDAIDKMIDRYLTTGTTGIPMLDSILDTFLGDYKKPGAGDGNGNGNSGGNGGTNKPGNNNKPGGDINWDDIFGKPSGSGSGGSKEPEDTRIVFIAVLNYKDELKNTELTRKGLSYSDKIDKLEVDE